MVSRIELFKLYQQYQVLICRKCQYCVRLIVTAPTTHLRTKHKSYPDVRPRDGQGEQLVSPNYSAEHIPQL